MFSCEYYEISKNTFFIKHLPGDCFWSSTFWERCGKFMKLWKQISGSSNFIFFIEKPTATTIDKKFFKKMKFQNKLFSKKIIQN